MGISWMIEESTKKNIVAIIPARGGSQRLKRKNIHTIWGKPMIYWPIKAAQDSNLIDDVWVTTEDPEIAEIAKSFGAKIHKRDPKLSEPHVYKMKAIRAAAKHIESTGIKPEIYISLQANSPEITSRTLDDAINDFRRYDRNELISVDCNWMQNAAFRIMKNWYVYQRDLSTKCGVYMCDLLDVHTIKDIKELEERGEPSTR